MDLETVILSEVREGEISHDSSHMRNIKRNDAKNLQNRDSQT